ncbi:hypothetical protein ACFQY5_35310 [Paeniroseomonas aquatica]|uniref:CopG family transcriptional regulator n=1 Tax=Paeniroseomonas aquatica TaxID=373043 RepID=A0ABT8A2W6_9PROT|nr:hypothetical protein [Paeniroseomonas aquatica]MDN3563909.1 hypothetical protein [Paeniroseomonas aquatica]
MPRPTAASAPHDVDNAPPTKRRPGRPSPGDTVQVTLRIPRGQLTQLVEEGAKRTASTGRTVTAQAILMELVEAKFPHKVAE